MLAFNISEHDVIWVVLILALIALVLIITGKRRLW